MPTNYRSFAAAAALSALIGAGGATLATLSTSGPVPATYTVEYTDDAFKVASTTATKTLATLSSSRQKLCGVTMDPQTAFAGTGITAVNCSLGSATGGNAAIYAPAATMTATANSTSVGGIFNGKDLATADTDLTVADPLPKSAHTTDRKPLRRQGRRVLLPGR